jgi:hypothetical protein
MKHVIGDQSELVAKWVAAGIPMMDLGDNAYTAIGLVDAAGYLHAGVVFNTYTGPDVILSIRLRDKSSITRRFIVTVFKYVFDQLRCQRCSALITRRNKVSQKFCRAIGFKYEGTLREWYADGQDAIVFGMLKRECRWHTINRPRRSTDGQFNGRATAATGDRSGRLHVGAARDADVGSDAGARQPDAGREPAPGISPGTGGAHQEPAGVGPDGERIAVRRAADAGGNGVRPGARRVPGRAAASLARAATRGRTQ